MTFHSILIETYDPVVTCETPDPPDFFPDLNLDQIVNAVTAGKEEYNLKPFYFTAMHDFHTISYRHEVMRDLENEATFNEIKSFERKMRTMREHLAQMNKLRSLYQKEGLFLDAVEVYCDAVMSLLQSLESGNITSRGLSAFREYIRAYIQSSYFQFILRQVQQLKADLSTVQYCILIDGSTVKVRRYASEADYSADVEKTFEKFKQGASKDYRISIREWLEMNHVEAQILGLVARLHPEIFLRLSEFYEKNAAYADEKMTTFDREIQFYVAYLEHIARLRAAGLSFCYPHVSETSKDLLSREGFDMALASKLHADNASVVRNDFFLEAAERVIVVSGPNQGGKTTFARAFGQLHYLASIGCLVPGTEAHLFLFGRLFTHFENEENIKNLRGKLHDDLFRIKGILDHATANSIIIMNEIFTSTALKDAIFLGKQIIARILQLDSLCVYVTFIDELSTLSQKTVSMVSAVVPDNPTMRTFKIERRPSDGLAYAISIAEKYRLTYEHIKERIQR